MKPVFKPKFSVPSSQQTGPKQTSANEKHICENEEPVSNSNDTNVVEVKTKSSHQESCGHVRSLTDDQYEDIFSSVLARAASGALISASREPTSMLSTCKAAEQFAVRTESISPTNVQNENEVTPNTSPQDEVHNPPKLLLQKPAKKKSDQCRKKQNITYKRKSLDYIVPGASKDGHLNKGRKLKHRKHKTDTELLKQRKKVLNKGVWVQCGDKCCLKWRYLQNCSDPSILPDYWICSMNKEGGGQNHCSAPEIDYTSCLSDSQDHYVYTEYNAGSIVWAKMPGYPSWPAMVDSDPDTDLFYEYDHCGKVLRYHVVFLDDNVSRAWIPARSIEPYEKNVSNRMVIVKTRTFKHELEDAVAAADNAVQLQLEQRLEEYSFEKRFLSRENKHKEWTPRKKKHHHLEVKNVATKNQQIVPTSHNHDVSVNKKTTTGSPDDDDYWDNASDNGDTMPKSSSKPASKSQRKSKKPLKPDKKHKEKETTSDCRKSNVDEKAKNPVQPTFMRNSCNPVSPKHDGTAVVPMSPDIIDMPESNICDDHETNLSCDRKLNLDPDIFTLETDGHKNVAEIDKRSEDSPGSSSNAKDQEFFDTSPSHRKNNSVEEPLDLSLKYNTAEEDESNSPDCNNKDDFGNNFWLDASDKKTGGCSDPFNDFVDEDQQSGFLQDWEDASMKDLDELMPVITDH